MSRPPAARPASAPVRVPSGTTAGAAVREAGLPTTGAEAVVVVRDAGGTLRDLAWGPESDADVEPVAADTEAGRSVIRHSAAHVLAQAVQQLHPEAKLGIGPPVSDGFYYDFDVAQPFTPDDLTKLESAMKKIIKSGQRFSRRRYDSLDEARKELADEPYKLELIDLKGGTAADRPVESDEVMEVDASGELTAYDNLHAHTGEVVWSDLCRGPHVPTTRYIPAFKLMRTAAAYWRGSEKNPQLQRVYGTAWESQEALEEYLHRLAEAERRDHRRLGAELDLFSFPDEIGSGLAVFHPKGGVVRKELEDYSRRRHEEAGYEFVNTPHITKGQLFQTSGHLDWYAEGMYPGMQLDAELNADGTVRKPGQDYYLKPMNCPMHNLIFRSRGRSYRELPLRLFEFGTRLPLREVGRGARADPRSRLHPGRRAHLLHASSRCRARSARCCSSCSTCCATTASTTSTSSSPPATRRSRSAATRTGSAPPTRCARPREASGLELVLDPGGAAFYAPKISVQTKDAIGRTWQMSTIQVDLMLPDRFDLTYTAADGSRQRPVMIHRALFGSIERFFGVLTEHYAGAFPAWLAPVQAVAIPVTGEQVPFVEGVAAALRAQGVRVEVDAGDDRMQKKIRTHTLQKVPFLLLAGARDAEAGAVSFRFRDGSQLNGVPVESAVATLVDWVRRRENTSPDAEAFRAPGGVRPSASLGIAARDGSG